MDARTDLIAPRKHGYVLASPDELWWCNNHRRRATNIHLRLGGEEYHCCDPSLGGIMIPCECVNLTNKAEMVD